MPKITEKTSSPKSLGLVISYFGNSVAVESEDGQVFQCHLRRNQELPVVGDKVYWTLQGETGTIDSILPRHTLLSRALGKTKTRPLAANVDYLFIVMAPPPIFSSQLVDRYCLAAQLLNITPVILLNKIDLLTGNKLTEINTSLNAYRAIPYPVILSSVITKTGLDKLTQLLKAKTGVLVGPSGVGKSSIIRALASDADIRIGDVSDKGAGKHTTTATRLYHLPEHGALIDSPGVREFNLWPVNEQEILSGFKEFESFLGHCKFRDCKHTVEPGCTVQAAVKDGKISIERFNNYLALMKTATKPYK